MDRTAADDLIDRYLDRLDQALSGVPKARRDDIVHEAIERIVDARAELPDRDDEDAVRALLRRMGPPEVTGAAERRALAAPGAWSGVPGTDTREKLAIVLLLIGGFFAGFGWLAGVVLLWLSPRWNDRDKLIGTLVVPGGLVVSLLLAFFAVGAVWVNHDIGVDATSTFCVTDGGSASCEETSPASMALWLLLAGVAAVAPLGSAAYLLHRLRATRPV